MKRSPLKTNRAPQKPKPLLKNEKAPSKSTGGSLKNQKGAPSGPLKAYNPHKVTTKEEKAPSGPSKFRGPPSFLKSALGGPLARAGNDQSSLVRVFEKSIKSEMLQNSRKTCLIKT